MVDDAVNHPSHYTQGPKCPHCGEIIECITVTENYNFSIGNSIKYLWRANLKGKQIEDLKKAVWYIENEIRRLEKGER